MAKKKVKEELTPVLTTEPAFEPVTTQEKKHMFSAPGFKESNQAELSPPPEGGIYAFTVISGYVTKKGDVILKAALTREGDSNRYGSGPMWFGLTSKGSGEEGNPDNVEWSKFVAFCQASGQTPADGWEPTDLIGYTGKMKVSIPKEGDFLNLTYIIPLV